MKKTKMRQRIQVIALSAALTVTSFGGLYVQPVRAAEQNTVALGKGSYSTQVKGTWGYSDGTNWGTKTNASLLEKLPYPGSAYRHATENYTGPVDTSDWASSFVWDLNGEEPYSHSVYALPLAYKASAEGMLVTMPSTVVDNVNNSYNMSMPENGSLTDFVIQPSFATQDAKMDKATDWSYDVVLQDASNPSRYMKTTMVQGSPFAYVQLKDSTTVTLMRKREGLPSAVVGYNGSTPEQSTMLVLRVYDNQDETKGYENYDYYALYVPQGTQLQIHNNGENIADISATFPTDRTYFSFAALTSTKGVDDAAGNAVANSYLPYAYNFVTDTRADYHYNEATHTLSTVYRYEVARKAESQADGTVMGILPHQYKNMKENEFLSNTYRTIRGTMKVMAGSSYTTYLNYTGVLPNMPTVANEDKAQLQTYIKEYMEKYKDNYLGMDNGDGDTYWTGKALNRVGNVLAAAEAVGDTQDATILYHALKGELENWFTTDDTEDSKYFYYDAGIGTLLGFPQSYNSVDQMNDHHFHYGYYIYAAAQVALRDPDWASDEQYGAMVKEVIGDIACNDRNSSRYPYLRNFSPYEGHAWASGHQSFADGNNQESSSEALNAWAGMILFGEATGNKELRDLGIYLYTTEISAVNNYWFDTDKDVLDDRYRYNVDTLEGFDKANTPVVRNQASMVWGGKYIYGTWWTAEPFQVQGINLLPMNPASFYLAGDGDYIKENLRIALERENAYTGADKMANPKHRWNDIWSEYEALADPDYALSYWDTSAAEESGESRAHTYHYIKVLQKYGTPDTSVSSNATMSSVFQKNVEKTYVVYNAEKTSKKVIFSDGSTFDAVPGWTIKGAADVEQGDSPSYGEEHPSTSVTPSESPSESENPSGEKETTESKDGRKVSSDGKILRFTLTGVPNVTDALVFYKLCDSKSAAQAVDSVAELPGYKMTKNSDGTWSYEVTLEENREKYAAVCFTVIADGKGTDTWLTLTIPDKEKEPSKAASGEPSEKPTVPSEEPSEAVSEPTEKPSGQPSEKPTVSTEKPSKAVSKPTEKPSEKPTVPSEEPSKAVSEPTEKPSGQPSLHPTIPTDGSDRRPTETPSVKSDPSSSQKPAEPSESPSNVPSKPTVPLVTSMKQPTVPTDASRSEPTEQPGKESTVSMAASGEKPSIPTVVPSKQPSVPTVVPSKQPSADTPVILPNPTVTPSETPSIPTDVPSEKPTVFPEVPSSQPSEQPSIPLNTEGKLKKIIPTEQTIKMDLKKTKRIFIKTIPENVSNAKLTVTTSDKKIILIKKRNQRNVLIQAIAPGTAKLIIKSVENPGIKANVAVIVRPAKVSGLKKSKVKKTSLKLSWKKQSGVSGYKIYQYNSKSGTYKLIKKTTKTYFSVTKLKAKSKYKFKVRAYKKTSKGVIYGSYSKVLHVKI